MIVKDVTRLARKLDKACKKGEEILGVELNYVGWVRGVQVLLDPEAFMRHFDKYAVEMVPHAGLPYKATIKIGGVTYFTLFSEEEFKKHGLAINGTEGR